MHECRKHTAATAPLRFVRGRQYLMEVAPVLFFPALYVQINLYLLSRILMGLCKTGVSQGIIPAPKRDPFPLFGAVVWAIVLWLFEYHQSSLQPSLQSSMTYLYKDSNVFSSLRNFLLYNKAWKLRNRPSFQLFFRVFSFSCCWRQVGKQHFILRNSRINVEPALPMRFTFLTQWS